MPFDRHVKANSIFDKGIELHIRHYGFNNRDLELTRSLNRLCNEIVENLNSGARYRIPDYNYEHNL